MLFELRPEQPQDFASFVTSDQLREARHVAEQAASCATSAYLWGKSGTGKSHLLAAAAIHARAAGRTTKFFTDNCDDAELTLIDDIEQICDSDRLFALLKASLQNEGRTILVAGRVAPENLALRDDVRSRVSALPSYRLTTLSDNEMCATLLHHAHGYERELDEAVAQLLVLTQPRNLGHLKELLDTLDEQAITSRERLSYGFARAWLKSVGKLR